MERGKREFFMTVFGLLLFAGVISYWFADANPTAQPVIAVKEMRADKIETQGQYPYQNFAFLRNNNTNETNHTACKNAACIVVQGPGKNQCNSNNDCINMTIKTKNITKTFNETNMTNITHNVCRNLACVPVLGPGIDQCLDYRDCNNTNMTWLVFKTLTNVTGSGSNASNATGGLPAADLICNDEARARGFGGSYVAWLSTKNTDARTRIVPGVYKNIFGSMIASSRMDLLDGTLTNAIDPRKADVWTGTHANGKYAGSNCNDWTSSSTQFSGAMGSSDQVSYGWTYYAGGRCDLAKALYCFQMR